MPIIFNNISNFCRILPSLTLTLFKIIFKFSFFLNYLLSNLPCILCPAISADKECTSSFLLQERQKRKIYHRHYLFFSEKKARMNDRKNRFADNALIHLDWWKGKHYQYFSAFYLHPLACLNTHLHTYFWLLLQCFVRVKFKYLMME